MFRRLVPIWPFGVRRQTWIGRLTERLRPRKPRVAVQGAAPNNRIRPTAIPPTAAQAPPVVLPVESTYGDEAIVWGRRAALHAFRQILLLRRLTRLDERLARLRVRRTLLSETFRRADTRYRAALARLNSFIATVAVDRLDEIERHPGALSRIATLALWLLDASIMITPWHLFGAPSLPFLPYGSQTAAATAFAVIRALLLSLVLVWAARRIGSAIRIRVDESATARRLASMAFVVALALSLVLLLRAAAEMQDAYLAIVAGGTAVTLPTSVFFVVTLFVAVASAANGFWTCSPLAERRERLEGGERREWDARTRCADALDRVEAAIARLHVRRRHLLAAAQELEHEQRALVNAELAATREADWPLYRLEPPAAERADLELGPVAEDADTFEAREPGEFAADRRDRVRAGDGAPADTLEEDSAGLAAREELVATEVPAPDPENGSASDPYQAIVAAPAEAPTFEPLGRDDLSAAANTGENNRPGGDR